VKVEFVVAEDAEAAALEAARRLADVARRGGAVALAGGSTPRRAYELAASLEPDWSRRAEVWLGDERCVPPDDVRSNLRLVRESLLDHLEGLPVVHPVRTELAPEDAAAAYAEGLRGTTLALVLLGLGTDGHTASLFPRAPSLDERQALAVAAPAALDPWVERVTLTIPALSAAREVVFLAVGPDKAEAARRAFAEPASPETPASLVRATSGRTTAILDRAAAAHLPPRAAAASDTV
jgi:6-phosphogluconolactonase